MSPAPWLLRWRPQPSAAPDRGVAVGRGRSGLEFINRNVVLVVSLGTTVLLFKAPQCYAPLGRNGCLGVGCLVLMVGRLEKRGFFHGCMSLFCARSFER